MSEIIKNKFTSPIYFLDYDAIVTMVQYYSDV